MKIINIPTRGFSSNCYLLISENEGVIIDPSAELSSITRTLREKQASVKYILLTHAHFDHMLFLEEARETLGVPLLVHENDASALVNPNLSLFCMLEQDKSFAFPEHTLSGGEKLSVGDEYIDVIHTPGHTPGSVCYKCGNKLITGDTLFNMSIGRDDFPGGDGKALRNSIKILCELPDETEIYPGHGESSTIGNQKEKNPYVRI